VNIVRNNYTSTIVCLWSTTAKCRRSL